MKKSLKNMPKIDLHCHLDGSIGLNTAKQLLKELNREIEHEKLKKLLQVPEECISLAEYLKCFELPLLCLQTKAGLAKTASDLVYRAAEENVCYLEVRFAPYFLVDGGLTVREVLESVRSGLAKAEDATGIRTGMIVCGMRHHAPETNLKLLQQAREMLGAGVVGCDLAGDENSHPNYEFAEYFKMASKLGIPYTIHAGECGNAESVKAAIEMGAKRLGHGIAMSSRKDLMKICAQKRIGVELCPTSNFQTKAVSSWKEYPLKEFMEAGIPISVNTDNRTVSGTDSTKEFEKVTEQFALTEEALHKIYLDSVEMAFAKDDCKEELLRKWS